MRMPTTMTFRARRVPCRTAVSLLRPDGTRAVGELRDVSLVGARLTGVTALGLGDRVRLAVLGRVRTARVRWCQGEAAGLLFEEALARRELRALAGAAGTALAATASQVGPAPDAPASVGSRSAPRPGVRPPQPAPVPAPGAPAADGGARPLDGLAALDRAALMAAIAASFDEPARPSPPSPAKEIGG